MTTPPRSPRRRSFLQHLGGSALLGSVPTSLFAQTPSASSTPAAPAIIIADSTRPRIPCGVMSGDVTGQSAMLWSRSDRPARIMVEYADNAAFRRSKRIAGPLALPSSDYSARLELTGLRPGQTTFYRIQFEDLQNKGAVSETITGSLRMPAAKGGDIRFCFSGDEAGQGFGINPRFGGYRIYETMRKMQPDFFIHSGDQIYADGPLQEQVKLDDGSIWHNIVTPAKAEVAQTLADFRGNFAYNFLDENKRRFAAEVPFLVQWDDHEVRNNWFPGQTIGEAEKRYQQRDASTLAAFARQAMFEYNPFRRNLQDPEQIYRSFHYGPLLDVFMLDERSYRGKNSPNRQTTLEQDAAFLGSKQLQWLKQELLRSRATWKVIASDMPISLVVQDMNPDVPKGTYEAWANGDGGAPLGRELELANLLSFVKQHRIQNLVWVTADVHYASATRYTPEKARFTDFLPFWEFVGGPLNAGTFGPNEVDQTFGPDVRFVSVPPDMKQNRAPSALLQFFGHAKIDATSRVMTVSLHDIDGKNLFQVDLQPA
ncbi:MAG: alkaline phosphatase D family protein [Burkholderiales bacterium]|nr:alkaline phosphatase D family protein [Burkholderiales bacterium]